MIISLVQPMMTVRYTKGGQLRYSDHIVNFPQDVSILATRLPRLPEEIDTVIIRRDNVDMSRHIDFIVRREKVQQALEYKIAHDPNYASIVLDYAALSQLPQNGSIVDRIPTCRRGVHVNLDSDAPEAAGPPEAGPQQSQADDRGREDADAMAECHVSGLLNLGGGGPTEAAAVRDGAERVVNGGDGPIQYSQVNIVSDV